jgi:hypothetical protein
MSTVATPAPKRPRAGAKFGKLDTPARLRFWLAATWASAALFAGAGFVGVRAHREGMQNLGRDSAPSIIAAQRVKAELAAMHAAAARELLSVRPEQRAAAVREYENRRRAVTDALLTAAGNITYGDAERVPIRTMLEGLGPYEGALAQARLLHTRNDAGFVDPLRRADALLTDTMLPAADALDRANQEALDAGYSVARGADTRGWVWLAVSGAAALAALVGTQLFLARKTRRLMNPALVLATAAVLFGLYSLGSGYAAADRQLRRAKDDCFESIGVLTRARADGYEMLAAERLALLDPNRAEEYATRFRFRRNRLLTPPQVDTLDGLMAKVIAQQLPPGAVRAGDEEAVARAWGELARKELPSAVGGHLAVELRNVTFAGEREAAVDTLRGFVAFLSADARVNDLSAAGTRDDALALALDDRPDGPARGFRTFDEHLGRTTNINHTEFDKAVDRGFAAVADREWIAVALGAGVWLLALIGLRPRFREYAD